MLGSNYRSCADRSGANACGSNGGGAQEKGKTG